MAPPIASSSLACRPYILPGDPIVQRPAVAYGLTVTAPSSIYAGQSSRACDEQLQTRLLLSSLRETASRKSHVASRHRQHDALGLFLQPAEIWPSGRLAEGIVSNATKHSSGGKRWIEPPARRDERRLGPRHYNVIAASRSHSGGFRENYSRTFRRAAFVHRHLSKLFSGCLDARGPGEISIVPRLCYIERCAFGSPFPRFPQHCRQEFGSLNPMPFSTINPKNRTTASFITLTITRCRTFTSSCSCGTRRSNTARGHFCRAVFRKRPAGP